ITQILIGIIGIVFGILLNFIDNDDSTYFLLIKIPYWVGILHVISGSLTVAAARNPKIPLVKGMLAMNAISAITAGLGIIFLSFPVSPFLPFDIGNNCNSLHYDTKEKCDEIQNISKGILIFLIVLAILEFCISISLASFGCKVLCRDPFTETPSMDSPLALGPGSLSSTTQTDLPVPLKKFYQGEPLALGYIISGSLAVAAARNPKIPLVQGALAMNVISAVTAGICIIFLGLGITFFRYQFEYLCYRFGNESEDSSCHDNTVHIIEGILAVLIVFTILEFCITISLASFGCKMLCRNTFTETVVVIYQNETPAKAEHPPIDLKQPEFS
ncbi:hypothetical protein E2320_000564, partial [Naja naja]